MVAVAWANVGRLDVTAATAQQLLHVDEGSQRRAVDAGRPIATTTATTAATTITTTGVHLAAFGHLIVQRLLAVAHVDGQLRAAIQSRRRRRRQIGSVPTILFSAFYPCSLMCVEQEHQPSSSFSSIAFD